MVKLTPPPEEMLRANRRRRVAAGQTVSGPCVVCGKRADYDEVFASDGWIQSQLTGKARGRASGVLYGRGMAAKDAKAYEALSCPDCRARLTERYPQMMGEARQQREQAIIDSHESAERHFRETWRDPREREFLPSPETDGRREFTARYGRGSTRLVFRWDRTWKRPSRGDSAAQVVGLWANGRLRAHYYGWFLQDPEVDGDDTTDIFGPGLARWMELHFQRALARRAPSATWWAKTAVIGRREDNGIGNLVEALEGNILYGGPDDGEPCVIHTVSPDGRVYAQLRNFYRLDQAVEFAAENLGLEITPRG